MSIEAMKTALEALEFFADEWGFTHKSTLPVRQNAIAALRAAIEQAEKQEPVAWQWLNTAHFRKSLPASAEPGAWTPLYAAPPQRQPLTQEAGLLEQNTELDKACAKLEAVNAQLLTALQQIIDLPEDSRIHYKVARRAIAAAKEKS